MLHLKIMALDGVLQELLPLQDNPTKYVVMSDNIFGSTDAWPIAVAPQNDGTDERLSEIIIEKNRFFADYGTQSGEKTQVGLLIAAREVTVRNNIFWGNGSHPNFYNAILVFQRGIELPPANIYIFNNTIYKSDGSGGDIWGIRIQSEASNVIIKNNLGHMPLSSIMINDESSDLIAEYNLMSYDTRMVNPEHSDYLLKDFSLQSDSPAQAAGTIVPVVDDFVGSMRPAIDFDIGAFQN